MALRHKDLDLFKYSISFSISPDATPIFSFKYELRAWLNVSSEELLILLQI